MKLRNKLILSCAALAAVATTAVSTTFAWYTSNQEVTAGGISAQTKNSGADLLMIADGLSKSGTTVSDVDIAALKWDTKIDAVTLNASDLIPLAYNGTNATSGANATGGALVQLAQSGEGTAAKMVTGTGTTDSEIGILKFVLYLKNGGPAEKDLTMKITNLTNVTAATALPVKSIVDPTNNAQYMGLGTTATNYTVNALRVAAMDLEVSTVTPGTSSYTTTLADETVYALNTANSELTYGDTIDSTKNTYSAHSYYNAVMTPDLDTSDTYCKDTASFASLGGASGTVIKVKLPSAATADNSLKLTFKIFLNGWDKSCFDACQNQNFTFGLDFTVPVTAA